MMNDAPESVQVQWSDSGYQQRPQAGFRAATVVGGDALNQFKLGQRTVAEEVFTSL